MTKLTFKRLALVVVTALGLGLLATGPTSATIVASSDSLTVSATSSTISAGETASVTVTQTAIAAAAGDSISVVVTNQTRPEGADGRLGFYVTDSSNATIRTSANTGSGYAPGTQLDYRGVAGEAIGTDVRANAGGTTALSATYRLSFMAPTVAGTYVFRIYAANGGTTSYTPVAVPLTWTVTVSANASDTATTASKFWMNRLAEYTAFTGVLGYPATSARDYKGLEVDSALVVTAGAVRIAANYTPHAVISPVIMNSSDTKVSSRTNSRVLDSMTITIAGAGQLVANSRYTGLGTAFSKQVTIAWDETAVVYSDGTVGTGTITAYVGSSSVSSKALTQGSKTIAFTGRATTFAVTGFTANQRVGSTVAYTGAADSATATGIAPVLRFTAADAAGNAVTAATLNTDQGEGVFYAISSDTSIVAAGEVVGTSTAARRSPALTCSYERGGASAIVGFFTCDGRIYDSGTVTLTIVDSRTLTLSGNVTSSTDHAVAKSSAFSVTIAGSGYTGTTSFGKTAFNVNEAATLTSTCKDSGGRNVADGNNGTCWSNLNWKGASPTFGANSSASATGGTFTSSLIGYLNATDATNKVTWVGGTDTALVYMPTTAGTYTLMGRTSGATVDSEILTITVTDPTSAATLAAAEAATDAAAEAIDAANAATDAANLAAEAADAATVAAEEARDAADAATAAVEELATQVATLMAALKAQLTTLANTVAKIAKKVKA